MSQIAPSAEMLVLDVGYSNAEFSPTDNYIERHYPFPERLVALGVEKTDQFEVRYPNVRAIRYDGERFPFADNEFDVCWSNAVLEHVGDHDRQLLFLQEIRRVSKRAFFTTPNRHFPVEVHTHTPLVHWLPRDVFNRYLERTEQQWAAGEYMYLLTEKDLRHLLAQAGFRDYELHRNRLMGLTLDFAVLADCV